MDNTQGHRTSIEIVAAQPADYPHLIAIWEASVRSSHFFLQEEDIIFYREFIQGGTLDSIEVYCLSAGGATCGFAALSGTSLEMLFLHPAYFRMGFGKLLLQFAIAKGIDRVEVNEQNSAALQFYQRSGFMVRDRRPLDGFGRPHPILALELEYTM